MQSFRSENCGIIRFGIGVLYYALAACSAVTFAQTIQPGVDRAKIQEYTANTALKFFDTSMNVPRSGQN